jgi:hypothetical protein
MFELIASFVVANVKHHRASWWHSFSKSLSPYPGGPMTHRSLSFLVLPATIILFASLAHAQQDNSTATTSKETEKVLREKAFDLLESLAGQIGSLQSAENRARMGSNIAESLWDHDEKRARALFASVEEEIRAALQHPENRYRRETDTFAVFSKLRTDTVERIAKHDAELALAFLKATEPRYNEPRLEGIDVKDNIELRLAKQIATNNPDLALKLGRKSLALGFSEDLLPLLRQLHRKDRAQGVILYKETVAKLRNADLLDWNNMRFAQELAASLEPPVADQSAFRDLINIFITTAVENGCSSKSSSGNENEQFCWRFGPLVAQMEKIDPLRAEPLKRWATETEGSATSRRAYIELSDISQTGTVDDVLALASKYPELETNIYWQAMTKAVAEGDIERARKIVTSFGGDAEIKQRMLEQVDRSQKWLSISDEQIAEIQKRLETVTNVRERLEVLIVTANRIGATDRKAAIKLLNQAIEVVDGMRAGKEQTEAQIGLAMMYCLEKSDRGFVIMESLIPQLNELVIAAAKLDGFDNRYLRDGEWNMTGEGGIGSVLTLLAQNAGYFAWCDFERAVNLAAQFDRMEIRLMAQLKLAQGILAGPPKRQFANEPRYTY